MREKPSHLKAFMIMLILSASMISITAQEVSIKGSVINPSQHPVGNVKVYLKSNPSISCYSDSSGLFQLNSSPTSATALVFNERISVNPDGSLQINALQNSLSIDIYDLLGRRVKEVIQQDHLNGTYRIHPGAYLNDLPGAIYIARVMLDGYSKGIKVRNLNIVDLPAELTRIADYTVLPESALKSDVAEDDTLVFSSDFYLPASIAISSYSGDVGVIQLENFGDYTVADGMDPDKTLINRGYDNFLSLTSEGGVEFEVNFDTASLLTNELFTRAIPISQLEFLPDSLEFISGIHLEPSDTWFLEPLNVWIKVPGRVSDSLIVFGYHNDAEDIYYLPYFSYTEGYYGDNPVSYLNIIISHFSGIGVARGMIPDLDQPSTRSLTDHISYLAFKQQQNQEISNDDWLAYYNLFTESVLKAGTSLESLKQDIIDMRHYLRNLRNLGVERVEDTEQYADFKSEVIKRINELYESFNEECTSTEDDCEKFHAGQKAAEALSLGFHLGLNDSLPEYQEFCDQEMVDFRDTISEQAFYLKVGDTRKLPVTLYNFKKLPLEEPIKWKSANPSIADVDRDGLVTGIGEGDVSVKGTWCDAELEIRFNVTEADCKNEFCKHEECANGIFLGRGSVGYRYEGYSPGYTDVHVYGRYNVFFIIDLNRSSGPKFTASGSYTITTTMREYGKPGLITNTNRGSFADTDFLSCSDKGFFSRFTANPISIEKVIYAGDVIGVKFSRITAYGTFTSATGCSPVGQ